ncbi:MAG: hypothetical protein H6658_05735 [Ardenticatenaceae bacterium]|nr:hypothetical protein [Ardenticatenaceae bacterium]
MLKRLFVLCALVGLTAVLLACSEDTPPIPAAVAELCSLESNTWVVVEGYMNLPSFLTCQEGRCRINFGNEGSGIMAAIRAGEEPRSNMMQLPPDQYGADDLQLVLDDGTTADRQTLVAVTGRVKRPSANDCYLEVSSLQRP